MKVKIIGFTHLVGKSKKTGNDYDFYQLSCTYKPEKGYTGERVLDISVNPECVTGIEKATLPIIAELFQDFVTHRVSVVL